MINNILKDKKLIIFDLDGTIIDSVGVWNNIDKCLIKRMGCIPEDNVGEYRKEVLHKHNYGNIYLNYAECLKAKYGSKLSKEEIHEIRKSLAKEYLVKHVDLKQNADKVLLMLKEKGYHLALATTTSWWNMDIYINENTNINSKIDFSKIFEFIVTKDDVIDKKPHPEAFLKCAEHFCLKPEACLIIEDSLIGLHGAKNANMEVICVYDEHSKGDKEELKDIATLYIENFDELIELIEGER